MGKEILKQIVQQWKDLTEKVKNRAFISDLELFMTYRDTYQVFAVLRNQNLVPREACQIVMALDEFTYYATGIVDDAYLEDIYPRLYYLNYALKCEFFLDKYQSEYFLGPEPAEIKTYVLDMENINALEFVRFLEDKIDEDYNDVKLVGYEDLENFLVEDDSI